jgi:hypothetical protein
MKSYKELLSEEECDHLKSFWLENNKDSYVNFQLRDEVIDRRLLVTEDKYKKEWDIVTRICDQVFGNTYHIWSAYQEQSFCHDLHIDDYYEEQSEHKRFTIVLSLDTIPEFKTVIWKEEFKNNKMLAKRVHLWELQKGIKRTNISNLVDLEHTVSLTRVDEEDKLGYYTDYFCDYLTLDNIFTYKKGSGVAFAATQVHCTSNWKKYPQFKNRQLLQIHALADGIK